MAMVESIWPSEQLAMALTTPVDPSSLDPADPQVGQCPPLGSLNTKYILAKDIKEGAEYQLCSGIVPRLSCRAPNS